MTHQGSDDLLLQLATRLYTLAEKGSTDIRPFSSVGHELQARYQRLAEECLRQMEYARRGVGISGPTTIESSDLRYGEIVPVTKVIAPAVPYLPPTTLAPPDWKP